VITLRFAGRRRTYAAIQQIGQLKGGCCRRHVTTTAVADVAMELLVLLTGHLQVVHNGLRLARVSTFEHSAYRYFWLAYLSSRTTVAIATAVAVMLLQQVLMIKVLVLVVCCAAGCGLMLRRLLVGRTGRCYNCRGIITVKRP